MVGILYLCVINLIFELNFLELLGICKLGENSIVYLIGQGISFVSLNFFVYFGNGLCYWNIFVFFGNFIRFMFWCVYGLCNSSYVEVYDVMNFVWINMRRFCFLFKLEVVYLKGSSLLVSYVIVFQSFFNGFFVIYEIFMVVFVLYVCFKFFLCLYDRIIFYDISGEFVSY